MVHMTPPEIQKFDGSAIPEELKAMRRWAPWQAVFNEKRGKYDKLPKSAKQPEYGISTASPEKWFTHQEALSAYTKAKGMLQGIGFVTTGIEGIIGLDMDGCREADGTLAPWAKELIVFVNSYTEVSPSGRGVRIFAEGEIDGPDWMNHEVGIEVYGGSSPRFLTVTGNHLEGTPLTVNAIAPGKLAQLRAMYARASSAKVAKADVPQVPDLLPEAPAIDPADLPPAVRDFLATGETPTGDRSRMLHSTGVALYSAGLTDQEVLTVLTTNPYTMEVALDHRGQDDDRATLYLWEHHCVAAKPKARSKALTLEDFEDLTATLDVPQDTEDDSPLDAFDDVSQDTVPAKPKKPKFEVLAADKFIARVSKLDWFIKGVMPKATIGAVFGASGSGKTFATLHMAASLAMGLDWYGIPTRKSKVLYIVAEGAFGMRDRLSAWCTHHGVSPSELGKNFYAIPSAPNMLDNDDIKLLVNTVRSALGTVDLVIVDTMAQVTPGANENSGEDMGKFLSNAGLVGKALAATVCLVGHSGKNADNGLRGWSGIKGALDFECEVVRTQDYRALSVTKLKDGVGEGREYRFTLDEVVLDFDVEDGVISSCVAAEGEVLDFSDAKDVASAQASGRRKAAKEASSDQGKAGRPSPRAEAVKAFLRGEAATDGRTFLREPLLARVMAHLVSCPDEGVGFTLAQADHGDTKRITQRVLLGLEREGFLRSEGDKVIVTENEINAPGTGTCNF